MPLSPGVAARSLPFRLELTDEVLTGEFPLESRYSWRTPLKFYRWLLSLVQSGWLLGIMFNSLRIFYYRTRRQARMQYPLSLPRENKASFLDRFQSPILYPSNHSQNARPHHCRPHNYPPSSLYRWVAQLPPRIPH